MTSKKLLSALMALVFALSLFTALPVSADEPTLQAALADGTPLAVDGTAVIPAVSTIVFTLPNAITEDDIETAIAFHEIRKGNAAPKSEEPTDAELWSVRNLKTPEISGNGKTVSFNFVEGDLSLSSQYRFTFNTPAVATASTFIFSTNATYNNWYVNDNFSRYPEASLTNGGNSALEFDSPWWAGRNRASREKLYFVHENGKSALRLNCNTGTAGFGGGVPGIYGAASFDNAYAPAFAGTGTTHIAVTEVNFAITGNPTSIYEFGGLAIATDPTTKQTGLYVRKGDLIQGTQTQGGTLTNLQPLGYNLESPTDKKKEYTIKFVTESKTSTPPTNRKFLKVWIGSDEVSLPAEGITVSWHGTLMAKDPVEYGTTTGLSHLLSATNAYDATGEEVGISTETTMDVYSYKYGTYVPDPVSVVTTPSDSEVSQTPTFSYTFSLSVDEKTLTNETVVLEEEDKRAEDTWIVRDAMEFADLDDATGKTLTFNFPAGALAPNTNYRISLKTGILSVDAGVLAAEPEPFEFKTGDTDNYLLYDNFSRYSVGAIKNPGDGTHLPFAMYNGWTDGSILSVQQIGNEKALRMRGYNGGKTFSYDNRYTGYISREEKSFDTVTEFEFTLVYEPKAIYEFAGVAIETVDEDTYNIYARTTYHSLNSRASRDMTKYTLIGHKDFDSEALANGKHILKIVTNTEVIVNSTNDHEWEKRTLYSVVLDEEPIGASIIGDGYALASGEHFAVTLGLLAYDRITETDTCMFYIATESGATKTPVIDLYSLKHAKLIDVVVSGTGAIKTIKITNNSGAAITGNVVLAAYNGRTLVGVTGLEAAAAETIADGATATVTRTVDDAVAGNTYKVMLLTSKATLQPLVNVVSGTIE